MMKDEAGKRAPRMRGGGPSLDTKRTGGSKALAPPCFRELFTAVKTSRFILIEMPATIPGGASLLSGKPLYDPTHSAGGQPPDLKSQEIHGHDTQSTGEASRKWNFQDPALPFPSFGLSPLPPFESLLEISVAGVKLQTEKQGSGAKARAFESPPAQRRRGAGPDIRLGKQC